MYTSDWLSDFPLPHWLLFYQIMHEYEELEPFWKRYNKVLLDKVTLDKERQVLLQENGQLRSLLKQYLDGISVNEEILSKVKVKNISC